MDVADGDRSSFRRDAPPAAGRLSGTSREGGDRARRQERAALRRIAAGEERRRAVRLAGALANGTLCSRFLPRRQIVSGSALGALAGSTLKLCLPSRRRGLIDLEPHLRALERVDLVRTLQRHAIETAAREAAAWPERLIVAVDLLPLAAAEDAALEAAQEALAATGLAPHRLVLQIDEGELVAGGLALRTAIAGIGAAGIGLAVRGFGETFGALGLPRDLPISALILDRTMLRAELDEAAAAAGSIPLGAAADHGAQTMAATADLIIARAAAALGRGAGLAVIADGIETAGEFARAAGHGIDFAQGPWIGPPLTADAFAVAIED